MPAYDYKCKDEKCDHIWEEVHSMKAEPVKVCPKCKKETAQRQIGKTSFVLAGSGWAKDNYS